jgi:hypothetical protein
MAPQASKLDFLSVSALRLAAASIFSVVILVPLGADADLARMSASQIGQLIGTGVLNLSVGDTLYIVAIVLLGVNFAYTVSLGLFALFSFALSVILLDESIGVATIAGSLLVLAGVYVVSQYRRTRAARPEIAVEAIELPVVALTSSGEPASATVTGRPGPVTSPTHLTQQLQQRIPSGVFVGVALLVLAALSWASSRSGCATSPMASTPRRRDSPQPLGDDHAGIHRLPGPGLRAAGALRDTSHAVGARDSRRYGCRRGEPAVYRRGAGDRRRRNRRAVIDLAAVHAAPLRHLSGRPADPLAAGRGRACRGRDRPPLCVRQA